MKKEILVAVMATAALSAAAEGYQVNTLSAKQEGMGHTGVAMHLGAESMYFNPAGLGFMNNTVDLSGTFTAIMPKASATVDGVKYETAADVSTPFAVHAAFSIYDNLKAGVSFYTPYGSKIDWTNSWPGAVFNQSVSLEVFTIQPTFAWRITDKLSIGAGVTVSWGNVDLNKGLVSGTTADKVLGLTNPAVPIPHYGNTPPASVNLKGTANVVAGVNVGVMYDINEKWTVGASFRTQTNMKVDAGTATLSYADEIARQLLSSLDILNSANFTAKMPCPWVLSFGASFKPVSRLTLAADARLTGWNAYKTLDIEFLDEALKDYNQNITKDYRNSWAVSLGAEYALTDRLDLRAGVMIDTTPVNKEYYNPETPGMTKIEPTVGVSFRPVKNFSIDLSFMYVAGTGYKDATVTTDDLLAKQINHKMGMDILPTTTTLKADYSVRAFNPSIGVSYSF